MQADPLFLQRRTDATGNCYVRGEPALKGIAAERFPGLCRKEWIARVAATFREPGTQYRDHWDGERRDPLLPPFAQAADVRTDAQVDIGTAQPNQLRDAQPGLDREREQ